MEIETPTTGSGWFKRGESSMHSHLQGPEAPAMEILIQNDISFSQSDGSLSRQAQEVPQYH